ncbi:cupin domain-containing protein [Pseudoroseomonas cervicalis]|uniref:cupin domain-containing protein n=1 Tax=Teichococcus cervicalis TaxID=204525 RepID=UPI0022F1A5A5|nr:cupin domain-containing protein [Pseudoroseomonas cervicalis]WBV42435.1 cupin domain-containing protein [Pseudoroseomonas cervicalis]
MRLAPRGLALLAALLATACATPPPAPPAAPPAAKVVEIYRGSATALGQPMRFPQRDGTLVIATYEIPPGARLPVHRHPQQRIAYVMAGRLLVATPEGRSWEYKAGDVVVEMLDHWHWGETLGEETVRLLVIDQTEGGGSNTELQH